MLGLSFLGTKQTVRNNEKQALTVYFNKSQKGERESDNVTGLKQNFKHNNLLSTQTKHHLYISGKLMGVIAYHQLKIIKFTVTYI